jgi:hypothetical protein
MPSSDARRYRAPAPVSATPRHTDGPPHTVISSYMSENPAIRQQPNGDVDIAVPDEKADDVAQDPEATAAPEASTNPENLDHPEELMGE